MMKHVFYAEMVSCEGSRALPGKTMVILTLTQDQLLGSIKTLAGSLTAQQWLELAAQLNKEFGL